MPNQSDQQLREAIRDSILIPLSLKVELVQWMETKASDSQKNRIFEHFKQAEKRKNDLLKNALKREGNMSKFKHFVQSKNEKKRKRKEFLDHQHDEVLLKAVEHELDEI